VKKFVIVFSVKIFGLSISSVTDISCLLGCCYIHFRRSSSVCCYRPARQTLRGDIYFLLIVLHLNYYLHFPLYSPFL
jgi:hypothetical protein